MTIPMRRISAYRDWPSAIATPAATHSLRRLRKWVDNNTGRKHASRVVTIRPLPRSLCGPLAAFLPKRKIIQLISAFFLLGLFPISTFAQCNDQLCKNLQNILDAAVTDFREYRLNRTTGPDVSIVGTNVPCQTSTWLNNVAMYICYAQVPAADSAKWYGRTLQALQSLYPTWNFQIRSQGEDHYVDAGPSNCEIPPNEGPYLGQCPLHLQSAKQSDGTAKLYLWVNSFSSPYLLKRPPGPPSKTVPPTVGGGCDDFCQSLKKAFEARTNAFEDIRVVKADGTAGTTVKLGGAKECIINMTPRSNSERPDVQFVCYWREASGTAADAIFRDLISRLQVLIPSNWSIHQDDEVDDPAGEDLTVWYGVEPGSKHDIRVYVSGENVGLHITAPK
jgi:hypothetical protein